jgi:16S rRNA processing protein RimM
MLNWDAMAVVGRIARAHGIRGQVLVNLETDFPGERFKPGATMYTERGGALTTLTLTTVRFQNGRPVIGLEGVQTMSEAEQLAGLQLRVPVEQLARLPADTFYHHDLVGCRVVTQDGRDVGTVQGVEGTFDRGRLVVGGATGEILIPLAKEICRTIDVAGKRIVIDPPVGLLDLNA